MAAERRMSEPCEGLRRALSDLREEMRTSEAETRRHFDEIIESLRRDIRALIEPLTMSTNAIRDVSARVSRLTERLEFDEAVTQTCFADLKQQIADLRPR